MSSSLHPLPIHQIAASVKISNIRIYHICIHISRRKNIVLIMDHLESWLLLFMILHLQCGHSLGSYFWAKDTRSSDQDTAKSIDDVAKFSVEPIHNHNGEKQLHDGKKMVVSSDLCWQNAYRNLLTGCSEILAVEEKRSRLAWHLSDCFQKDSGRSPFPYCDSKSPMKNCLQKLDADAHDIYLEFYLETSSVCLQMQADTFKRQLEGLVVELKMTAKSAEEKIDDIEGQTEYILEISSKIGDSLASISYHTQQLAQESRNVEDRAGTILKHMEAVHEQSINIASFQSEILKGQRNMKQNVVDWKTFVQDVFTDLDTEINKIKHEAVGIENDIDKIGHEMSLEMKALQNKADAIGKITAVSLDMQNELLDGQSDALEVIQQLSNFLTQALKESRGTLERMAEIGHKQQEKLLRRQQQLKQTQEHLIQNSKTILAAQEDFESKQSTMFLTIDKLFALHNAIILESQIIKAFVIYSISIFIIYMFTSTRQTYSVRSRLYIGLCIASLFESFVPKYVTHNIEQQAWIVSVIRSSFLVFAAAQLLYAIFTYRNYEALNHQMLTTLIDEVNGLQRIEELPWYRDEMINWPAWILTDLPEDEHISEDPDYFHDEGGDNSVATTTSTETYSFEDGDSL